MNIQKVYLYFNKLKNYGTSDLKFKNTLNCFYTIDIFDDTIY